MKLDDTTNQIFIIAYNEAKLQSHEFVTPEHILAAAMFFDVGKKIIHQSGGDIERIQVDLQRFFDEQVPKAKGKEPIETQGITKMFESTAKKAALKGKELLKIEDLMCAFYELPESYVVYILTKNGVDKESLFEIAGGDIDELVMEEVIGLEPKDETAEDKPSRFISDMTAKAAAGKYDPLIGREEIIQRTEQVLLRRTKNNPIHVGEPGVGKTAVVEGIARKIAMGTAPEALRGCKIYHLDLAATLAGTKYRGDFEERLKGVLQYLSESKDVIVYIDEIHTLVGTGSTSGGTMDASNILKPYLTEGNLRFIGSTTYEEYKKFFEKDKALSRRFQKIEILEPSEEEAVKILEGLKDRYAKFHNVSYPKKVLELAVALSTKYINDRFLPDKAIDVIDEAGASLRMRKGDIEKRVSVTEKDIEKTVSLMAKIPEKTVSSDEISKLKSLERELKKHIFGQDQAIDTVVNAIKRSRSGFEDEERPVASLMFVGPTGVGKTEIARTLAKTLNVGLVRFDMSEYQERHAVSRMIGAPPGYVGYEEGGLLTEQIRKTPHSVLLLDEIEKAHPEILNVLLQVMDYGKLTDSNGKKVDFKNVILIMTSNAGARDAGKALIGFDKGAVNMDAIPKAVENSFAPEFRNRLDDIVVFNSLDSEMARKIAEKELKRLEEKLRLQNIRMTVTKDALAYVAEKGISMEYGAREILRYIDIHIKRKLVDFVLFENKAQSASVRILMKDEELLIRCK